ncbi:putative NADH:ubiquinone reductase (H(+)-translocating) [Lupinus albus]|uniref:Putative NADH:ubiquinone reductase (H(+)-translocating) n=1 Tax=Lupinus albus TaxID=3870 RepID=A0A6A4NYZ6_LUPAL|nr:putative NADH:ubiquinone reductase (H(+)-translocating) [Lupinus albus]
MDRDKSLLLAMTSSFITSSFPYPPPLFSFTHQMAVIMAFGEYLKMDFDIQISINV